MRGVLGWSFTDFRQGLTAGFIGWMILYRKSLISPLMRVGGTNDGSF